MRWEWPSVAGAPASGSVLGPTGFFPSYLVPTPFNRHATLVHPLGTLEALRTRCYRHLVNLASLLSAAVYLLSCGHRVQPSALCWGSPGSTPGRGCSILAFAGSQRLSLRGIFCGKAVRSPLIPTLIPCARTPPSALLHVLTAACPRCLRSWPRSRPPPTPAVKASARGKPPA